MKTKSVVKIASVAIAAILALITVVVAVQPNKNFKRVEWVDENGKKHVTFTSGPATPAPAPTATPAGSQPATEPMPHVITAKVIKVVSPDTFIIEGDRKVKYVGVAAPDEKDPFYKESLDFHKKTVEGKYVNIVFDAQPKAEDGTLLGLVFINQLTFVNADLIRFGHARASVTPPNVKYEELFTKLQERAQTRKLGVWSK